MRKNGFTLIELLAVIVILAIIALIATPIILGIINDAREESNERSVELYASAVRNGIAAYQLTGLNAPKSFSDLTIQYDGNVECSKEILYEDGSFYLEGCKVNGSEKEYGYGTKRPACSLEDKDGDGTATLRDMLFCGTEKFYVLNNDGNNIEMITEYNLDVGLIGYPYDYDLGWVTTKIQNPTGIQSSKARGYVDGAEEYYGTVSPSAYWYDYSTDTLIVDVNYESEGRQYPYVYKGDEDDTVSEAIRNYVDYLSDNNLDVISSKLLSKEEANIYAADDKNKEWLYKTSFWLGSSSNDDYTHVEYVDTDGAGGGMPVGNDFYLGVRPVITISTSDIQ